MKRQHARSRLASRSSCLFSGFLVYVSIQPRTTSLDDWPASRHVTGTGHVCYPKRSSKRTSERVAMCGASILTIPRVCRSLDLVEGLGYQGMRCLPIRAVYPVVHVGDGRRGVVSCSNCCLVHCSIWLYSCWSCLSDGVLTSPWVPAGVERYHSRLPCARRRHNRHRETSARTPSVLWLRVRCLVWALP